MLLNVFSIVVMVFCKARCCVFMDACTKLLTRLLMLDLKKKKEKCVFCLYSAETMQKLIKGGTVLSQSRVGCIQIWSHIIYTSWRFTTVLELQTFPGEPKRKRKTYWRNRVTTFCTDFFFYIYMYVYIFLSAHFIV